MEVHLDTYQLVARVNRAFLRTRILHLEHQDGALSVHPAPVVVGYPAVDPVKGSLIGLERLRQSAVKSLRRGPGLVLLRALIEGRPSPVMSYGLRLREVSRRHIRAPRGSARPLFLRAALTG